MWGRRYKKEELANKLELLNRQKLKYDWDNDDLEYSEGIVGDAKPEDDVSANFPGIELESDNPGADGISAVAVYSLSGACCPNGGTLSLKKDIGVCDRFPYIDLDKLDDHCKEAGETAGDKTSVLSKTKNTMGIPKTKTYTFVNTAKKNMEGFTKQDLKGAYLSRKAQNVLAHPSDSKLSEVRDMPGITNIPSNAHAIANTNHIYSPDPGVKGESSERETSAG